LKRALAAVCLTAALVAGCDSETTAPARPFHVSGPPDVVRVALRDFRWPLDPALVEGRDEIALARTLYATPLRTDLATGAVVPGLCSAWRASPDFREWSFTCRSAPSIAAALRRVVRLRDAPSRWLFADAVEIAAETSTSLVVRLGFPWRRFPYALTNVAAAPRFVPGPFQLVSGSRNRVVVRRTGLTVVFLRLGPRAAVRAFRRGEVDEAPVPVGDIVAAKAAFGAALRSRTLLGLDLVVFKDLGPALRRVYWQTANRGDYEELIPQLEGAAAFGVIGSERRAEPSRFRRALKAIASLPRVRVRVGVASDPTLRAGARLLYAQWRDVGLGPQLAAQDAKALDASFARVLAAYPQQEAIPAELVLRDDVPVRAAVLDALAATGQRAALVRLDEQLRALAIVVPVAWVVDARLVSPRLTGWREDVLGNVDYAAVRSRASSRSR
jgi:hypothetical protein